MNQSAPTNLDQDLRTSRAAKYQRSEKEVSEWLYSTLSLSENEQTQYATHAAGLMQLLKDGRILCKLGNLLELPQSPTTKCKNSRMPFVQMENISFFLKLCEMVGVAHDEIFQTVDLFDEKDPYQVIITLMSFSRRANELRPDRFPTIIGPKVVKVKPQVPVKPFGLRKPTGP